MTKSLEDYLETIQLLIRNEGAARVRDVAHGLNVKMPSVVKAIGELKKQGLVTQEPYGNIELTEKGSRVAAMVLGRHVVLKAFLLKLGVSERIAEKDACLMEHVLSAETMAKVQEFLGDELPPRPGVTRLSHSPQPGVTSLSHSPQPGGTRLSHSTAALLARVSERKTVSTKKKTEERKRK